MLLKDKKTQSKVFGWFHLLVLLCGLHHNEVPLVIQPFVKVVVMCLFETPRDTEQCCSFNQQMISEIPRKGNKLTIYCLLPEFYRQRRLRCDSTNAYAVYFKKKQPICPQMLRKAMFKYNL